MTEDDAVSCQWCGAEVSPDDTRCPDCGRRTHVLTTSATSATSAVPPPLPPLPRPPRRTRRFEDMLSEETMIPVPVETEPPARDVDVDRGAEVELTWRPPEQLDRPRTAVPAAPTGGPTVAPAPEPPGAESPPATEGDQFVWPPPWMPAEEPTPLQRSKRLRVVAGVAAVVVVALLGAFIASQVADEGRGENEIKPTELKAGQCFNAPREELVSVELRPCTDDHEHEVFAVVNHPASRAAPYPGDEEILNFAGERCIPLFERYGSVPYEQANLADFEVVPTKESWEDGERRVICAVSSLDGEMMRGSVRAQRQ